MTSQYLYINILTVDFHGLQEDMVCIWLHHPLTIALVSEHDRTESCRPELGNSGVGLVLGHGSQDDLDPPILDHRLLDIVIPSQSFGDTQGLFGNILGEKPSFIIN